MNNGLYAVMTIFVEWLKICVVTAPFAQACRQVLRFGGKYICRGKDFVFIVCLKQIFLGTTKFGGAVPPNASMWLRAWQK